MSIDFPTNDYLSDVFSDVLDNYKVHWSVNAINQSGVHFVMNDGTHFNLEARVKYYKTVLVVNISTESGGYVKVEVSDFDSFRDMMSDVINSCSELNGIFDDSNFITASGLKFTFSSGDYFITDFKSIKLFLSSLNIICHDCGLINYNITFANDCVLVSHRGGDVPREMIEFIEDHEYAVSRNQIIIKTNFDWCEKN